MIRQVLSSTIILRVLITKHITIMIKELRQIKIKHKTNTTILIHQITNIILMGHNNTKETESELFHQKNHLQYHSQEQIQLIIKICRMLPITMAAQTIKWTSLTTSLNKQPTQEHVTTTNFNQIETNNFSIPNLKEASQVQTPTLILLDLWKLILTPRTLIWKTNDFYIITTAFNLTKKNQEFKFLKFKWTLCMELLIWTKNELTILVIYKFRCPKFLKSHRFLEREQTNLEIHQTHLAVLLMPQDLCSREKHLIHCKRISDKILMVGNLRLIQFCSHKRSNLIVKKT